VRNQIILDVRQAAIRYQQSRETLALVRKKIRPEVEAAIKRIQSAYKEGDVSYLLVLETTRQLLDTHMREALLISELRRSWADLERGVGRRLAEPGSPALVGKNDLPMPRSSNQEGDELPPPRKSQ
jgi:cobalt-zinc-cadmium efflux system outer membrane protein